MEMKKEKSIASIIIVIAIISFSYGIMVGHYNFFPFEQLKELKILVSEENSDMNKVDRLLGDVRLTIDIEDDGDVKEKREQLRDFIWKNSKSGESDTVLERSIIDERYSKLQNLKQIDKISILMEHGINSKSYLFLADESNNELVIYHQGHDGDFFLGINTIKFLLDNNYNVLAFSMPLHGMNDKPIVDIPRIGKMELFLHQQLGMLDNENFSSIKFFVEPIFTALDIVEEEYNFNQFHMIGISGGGWTSTIYPAIDDRISKSFSIAGGLPLALRTSFEDKGDYEQVLPEMYRLVNYSEMFVLASNGEDRKYVQIFNKFDPCCYAGEKHEMYSKMIKTKVESLGEGYFESYTDVTHKEHKISNYALKIILEEIKS